MNSFTPPPPYLELWWRAKPEFRSRVLALLDSGVVPKSILAVIFSDGCGIVLGPDWAKRFFEHYEPLLEFIASLDLDQFPIIIWPHGDTPGITSSRVVPTRRKRWRSLN